MLRDEGSLFSSLNQSRIPFRHENQRGDIRPNLVKAIGPVGHCGSAQAALWSATKLSGGSASSGVSREVPLVRISLDLAAEKGPEIDQRGLERRRPFSRGTGGSNPSSSSGESSANRLALEILGSVHERGRSPDAVTTAKTAGGMIRQFRLSSGTRRIAHDSVRRSGSAPAAPFARTRDRGRRWRYFGSRRERNVAIPMR